MSDSNISVEPSPESHDDQRPLRTTWGVGEVLLGVLAAFVFGFAFVMIFRVTASDPERMTLPAIFCAVAGGWLGYSGSAYFFSRKEPGGFFEQIGLRFELVDIPKGVLTGLAGQILAIVIYTPIGWLAPDVVETLGDPASQLTSALEGWRWIVFGLLIAVISPINEEIFFRGFAYRAFASRWGIWAGIITSGILFGIIHLEPLQTLALGALGILLAWRVSRTGRLGEAIIAHSTFNLVTVISLYAGWGSAGS